MYSQITKNINLILQRIIEKYRLFLRNKKTENSRKFGIKKKTVFFQNSQKGVKIKKKSNFWGKKRDFRVFHKKREPEKTRD